MRGNNGKKPRPPVHEELRAVIDKHGATRHVFATDGANQLWIGETTEHRAQEGNLYFCAFKDVHFNRIVGYSIDSQMTSRLAVAALNNAVTRRGGMAG